MAGAFGYEQQHYDLSMQIGELVLFPTIRSEAPSTLIAAPEPVVAIRSWMGRAVALHPVQILRQALKEVRST